MPGWAAWALLASHALSSCGTLDIMATSRRCREGLGGELGVAGRGQLPLQVLQDIEREAADHRDD